MPKPARTRSHAVTPATRPALRRTLRALRWAPLCSGLLACAGAQPPAAREPRAPLPADVVAKSALPLYALRTDDASAQKLTEPALWDQLAKARVVCFGEQ